MGKKKQAQQGRLAAILAENEKRTKRGGGKGKGRRDRDRVSEDSSDTDVEVELTAVQMMDRYDANKPDDEHNQLRKRLRNVRGENRVCCCLSTRHLVGCCLIILVLLGVGAVVVALNWADIKKMWEDA